MRVLKDSFYFDVLKLKIKRDSIYELNRESGQKKGDGRKGEKEGVKYYLLVKSSIEIVRLTTMFQLSIVHSISIINSTNQSPGFSIHY